MPKTPSLSVMVDGKVKNDPGSKSGSVRRSNRKFLTRTPNPHTDLMNNHIHPQSFE